MLPELTDVIIKSKVSLFVCAVGVPPKEMVDKLHSAGIPVMKYVSQTEHTASRAFIHVVQHGWTPQGRFEWKFAFQFGNNV